MIVYADRPNPYRCSGKQQITNLKRTKLAYVCYNLINAEKHVARMPCLNSLAIYVKMKMYCGK